jgi:hypothetical protein
MGVLAGHLSELDFPKARFLSRCEPHLTVVQATSQLFRHFVNITVAVVQYSRIHSAAGSALVNSLIIAYLMYFLIHHFMYSLFSCIVYITGPYHV